LEDNPASEATRTISASIRDERVAHGLITGDQTMVVSKPRIGAPKRAMAVRSVGPIFSVLNGGARSTREF
jgi:hypothetical protein